MFLNPKNRSINIDTINNAARNPLRLFKNRNEKNIKVDENISKKNTIMGENE